MQSSEFGIENMQVQGEQMALESEQNRELVLGAMAHYLGRIDFGKGSIDARDITEEQFMDHLNTVSEQFLMFVPDLRQRYGGCMDGRGNLQTDTGKPVAPRPKVIGGPSLFAHNVATVAGLSIVSDIDDPLEQFAIVNKKLVEAGFHLGMHRECGAARGAKAVLETHIENFDTINQHLGTRSREVAMNNGKHLDDIRKSLEIAYRKISQSPKFTEDNMIEIVQKLDGLDAIVNLRVDHDHSNHGHDEIGLGFVDVENAVVLKDASIENTGKQVFWQVVRYGRSIVQALARTQAEFERGIIVADQLPIAGIGTLGVGQHVGEISSK
ncbi:MAG: hypothetical protein NTX11_01845 [Candidatus Saccharibacteria bacterium]|nr:hypothetical protein [Candidatus Saccharibacteria bacterium]